MSQHKIVKRLLARVLVALLIVFLLPQAAAAARGGRLGVTVLSGQTRHRHRR